MNWVFDIIKEEMKKRFTGSIQIHFFKGGIANITKVESIKPPKKTSIKRSAPCPASGGRS